ncbi:hypothetical protein C8A05DRAFT_29752 [Staphylotrichum tortipilum]|uniref:Uncharacterized protein n=1 Tax=Staphylotrichum tortipilum TaxID=2831512 RepID=A0AAN6RWT2_9PEZI|nr:hypothetical protein C8A05DRAFT_29752 [Staphylotrichum longicolle]
MPFLSTVANLADRALRQVNRLVPLEHRRIAYARTKAFAAARPLLFSFIVTQLIFTAMPLAFFISFIVMVLVSATIFSILLSLFWTGLALFFVVPVLAICLSVGLFSWAVGLVTFHATRWLLLAAKTVVNSKTGTPRRRRAATTPSSSGTSSPPSYKTAAGGEARKPKPAHPAPGSGAASESQPGPEAGTSLPERVVDTPSSSSSPSSTALSKTPSNTSSFSGSGGPTPPDSIPPTPALSSGGSSPLAEDFVTVASSPVVMSPPVQVEEQQPQHAQGSGNTGDETPVSVVQSSSVESSGVISLGTTLAGSGVTSPSTAPDLS